MKITVISTRDGLKGLQQNYNVAVVLDILRATTTITTALWHGCGGVIPVAEVDEARELAKAYPGRLLGGERGSVKLPGFHLGNSPLEYTGDVVAGRQVVLTTTNGTGTIKLAAQRAPEVLIGSLLNAAAVAGELLRTGDSVLLACAGTRGNFSLEDTLGAGWIIKEVLDLRGDKDYSGRALADNRKLNSAFYQDETPMDIDLDDTLILDDNAVAAYRLAQYYGGRTLDALFDSLHGQKLAQLGMINDLIHCAKLNTCHIVPCYKDGIIMT